MGADINADDRHHRHPGNSIAGRHDLGMPGKHPCFDEEAAARYGRIHLPVAPLCNIRCNYCELKGCVNEHRPGLAQSLLEPNDALKAVEDAARVCDLQVVGVAGPGDALANEATFESLALVHAKYPSLTKCVSTNGFALLDSITELQRCGVDHISVTVNAIRPATALKIYESVDGRTGIDAALELIDRQMAGISGAVRKGILVKINTVLILGVNDSEVEDIAKHYAGLGVRMMNIVPLIPLYRFKGNVVPGCAELKRARDTCEAHIRQFRMCQQCRADSVGLICDRKRIGNQ